MSTTAWVELTAVGDDSEERRRRRSKARGALIAVALLAFLAGRASMQPKTAPLAVAGGHDFGPVAVGVSSGAGLTIENRGDVPTGIAGITIDGTSSGDFDVDAAGCREIPRGGKCTLSAMFAPQEPGPQSASLRLIDGNGAATEAIVVRGVGVQPVVVLETPEPPPPQPPAPPVPEAPRPEPPRPPPPRPTWSDVPLPQPPTPEPAPQPVPEPQPPQPPPEQFTRTTAPETAPATTTVTQPQPKKTPWWKKAAAAVAIGVAAGVAINEAKKNDRREEQPRGRAAISVDPDEVIFDGSAPETVYVNSVGTAPLVIQSVSAGGRNVARRTDCEGRTLAPGTNCTVTVMSASPRSAPEGALIIRSNGGNVTVAIRPRG